MSRKNKTENGRWSTRKQLFLLLLLIVVGLGVVREMLIDRPDQVHITTSGRIDMCLSCHTNFDRYQLLTDHGELDIVQTHEWLPNQALHFTKVRCIECHTQINDTILVAHLLLPKSEAVQRCTECHSQNTRLMETLYKFKSREQRQSGFFNGIIINESYVIGANRNKYLNILSFIILGGTLFGIGIHLFFRILLHKKLKHES